MDIPNSSPSNQNQEDHSPKDIDPKLLEFLSKALELVNRHFDLKEKELTIFDAPVIKSGIRWSGIIIIIVLLSVTGLLIIDKIDKSNYTFVIGAILGYLFNMVKSFFAKGDE